MIQAKNKNKLLVMKKSVSDEHNAIATANQVVGGSIAANATGSIPAYDEKGNLLGYIALFDTANLT